MKKLPSEEEHHKKQHVSYECSICGHNLPFQMPDHIVEDLRLGRVVFFAGAGISSENSSVWPYTLYADVKQELGIPFSEKISFSELMSRYCAQPNGRKKLLQKIQERLRYTRSFQAIDRFASRFHRELSTLFPVDTIITTNWDDYFERECGAVPFVTAADFALWDIPGRKVFKIHGSINNYGSIVATAEDYKACHEQLRDGILGAVLKQIIGTKTVIYVGYSFQDTDFIAIYRFLRNEMGAILPSSYIVTLDTESDAQFRDMGLIPIRTDATYFVSILKRHLVLDGEMLDDKRFEGVFPELLERIMAEGSRFRSNRAYNRDPNSIYVWSYQDGLVDALERMITVKDTGTYSHICDVVELVKKYMQIRKDKLRSKAYIDVAYIDGYVNGLTYLLADDEARKYLPLYYVFGQKETPQSLTDYRKTLKKRGKVHKAAYHWAEREIGKLSNPELTIHHPPFLL
jgi:NAD-dependent SIR2 family protein deacetylase